MLKPLIKKLLGVVLRLLFRLRVEGDLAGLDGKRLLIIANHESFLDGLLFSTGKISRERPWLGSRVTCGVLHQPPDAPPPPNLPPPPE